MADLKKLSILMREAMLSEIHECWTSPQITETCISLIKSVPHQITAVIQAKGGLTKYQIFFFSYTDSLLFIWCVFIIYNQFVLITDSKLVKFEGIMICPVFSRRVDFIVLTSRKYNFHQEVDMLMELIENTYNMIINKVMQDRSFCIIINSFMCIYLK